MEIIRCILCKKKIACKNILAYLLYNLCIFDILKLVQLGTFWSIMMRGKRELEENGIWAKPIN
jgi:hypothetical protein